MIYARNDSFEVDTMHLTFASVDLDDNTKTLSQYNITSGSTIEVSKQPLSKIPGLIVSYEMDMISFDDNHEARAKMICGHVISTESMTQFLRSLISEKRYFIKCPGNNS